jgi:RhoGEF domain
VSSQAGSSKGGEPPVKVDARTNIAREILSTEESYMSALLTITDVYVKPLQAAGISPDIISRIFSNVKLLFNVNTILLEDLR